MIINKESKNKELKNNILFLSQQATEAKKRDPNVINSTSGMMKNDDGSLYVFKSVKKANDLLNGSEKFAYQDTAGTPNFQEAVKKWVFKDRYEELKDDLRVVSTPGGSGAIGILFANYLAKGETVLLPNHMWEIYLVYAKEFGIIADTYDLFDIKSLILKMNYLKQKQDRITIILNDPCENPTGYCMKEEDYDELADYINNNPIQKFVIMLDMAYFDFYNQDGNIIRDRYYRFMQKLGDNALVLFAFSGSKTFGLYGLRIGALMLYSKDEEEKQYFYNSAIFSSRARWSSASTYGTNLITKIIEDKALFKEFEDELKDIVNILDERKAAFMEEALRVGLPILPYEKGFFVCVLCKDPEHLMNALHQDKVYLIVTKNCVRIALCAINKQEARVLPQIIKGRMSLEGME